MTIPSAKRKNIYGYLWFIYGHFWPKKREVQKTKNIFGFIDDHFWPKKREAQKTKNIFGFIDAHFWLKKLTFVES